MAKEKDKKVTENRTETIKKSAECLTNLRKGYCKPPLSCGSCPAAVSQQNFKQMEGIYGI